MENTSKQKPVIKGDNTIKDPEDWTTGDEPMTGAAFIPYNAFGGSRRGV